MMDNILIVIAAIAFFLFRTYMNYKKEQEEASTRNPSVPQKRTQDGKASQGEQPPLEIPKWLEDFLPQQPEVRPHPEVRPQPVPVQSVDHQGSIEYVPVKYERVKYIPTELPADLLKEYRSLPEKKEIDDVKRAVAMRASHSRQHEGLLKPLHLEEDVEAAIDVPRFDLREAIVMNAILERPYR